MHTRARTQKETEVIGVSVGRRVAAGTDNVQREAGSGQRAAGSRQRTTKTVVLKGSQIVSRHSSVRIEYPIELIRARLDSGPVQAMHMEVFLGGAPQLNVALSIETRHGTGLCCQVFTCKLQVIIYHEIPNYCN